MGLCLAPAKWFHIMVNVGGVTRMANRDHVAQLKRGVEAWNRWREQNWNVKPDLSGLDLINEKGIRSSGLWNDSGKTVDIRKANLQWANLEDANFRGAVLEDANLTEAILSRADFRGADLSGANLSKTDLSGTNLMEANLIRADLSEAKLVEADLRTAHLSGAILQSADLSNCDLRSAQLSAANLAEANLTGADLWVANFSGASLAGANLSQANLIRTDFQGADLQYADLFEADLRDANLQAANLEYANVIGITYSRRYMRGKYQGIRGVEASYGDAIFRRDALDQDYIDTLASRWRRSPMIVVLWLWSLVDYGRSIPRIVWISTLLVITFGLIFDLNPTLIVQSAGIENWFSPYYASIITFTTLGFSNFVMANSFWGQLLLTIEVLLGYFMLGIMITIMLQRIARRS